MQSGRSALLFALALLWVGYALAFVQRSSCMVEGQRVYALFDDAMVSMAYARTLAEGHGLVWYPGAPRVEGFTNLLWTLWMAALHATGVGMLRVSLLVQLSAIMLLALNLVLVWRLARELTGNSYGAGLAAVVLVGACLPLNTWGLQGMEVAPLAPLLTGALLLAIRRLGPPATAPSPLPYALLGLGTLLRPDVAVLLLACAGALAMMDRAHWRRHALYALAALLLFGGGQTVFRWLYYGDLLPNTCYLKMTGYPAALRVSRGLIVLAEYVLRTGWPLCLAPLVAVVWRRNRRLALIAVMVVAQAGYSAYAGGDVWEDWGAANRYLSVMLPGFLVMFAWMVHLGNAAAREYLTRPWLRALVRPASAGLVLLAAVAFATSGSRANLRQLLLLDPPLHAADNWRMVRLGLKLRQCTTPDARIAVLWAGSLPYFAQRPAVDILGKNDPHIARLTVAPPAGPGRFRAFMPGHTKWDLRYTIHDQRPDLIVHLFPDLEREARPWLRLAYEPLPWGDRTLWVRRDSPAVDLTALRHTAATP
ncbi:MAG: chromate transporter [Armatimonadetes bacterium]|nr:chromate transporter [Armatimonadota bacterium]